MGSSEPPAKLNFRKMLKSWREQKTMTQEELGHAIGKSQQWVWKVERGDQSVKLEDAEALANALNVPFRALLIDDSRVASDLAMTREQVVAEMADARAKADAARERGDAASKEAARLRAKADAARVESNRAENAYGYYVQRVVDLGRLLAQKTDD